MTSAHLTTMDRLEARAWAEAMAGREAPIVVHHDRAHLTVGGCTYVALLTEPVAVS